jgi:xylulokinase
MLMYGSTMFFVQVVEGAVRDRTLWTTQGVDPGARTVAAGMSTAGTLTEWVRALAGGASWDELIAEAAAVEPGACGLLLLPYFAGERTPIYDPYARGVVAGLTLAHGRGELLRAAYEGIAYGVRQILATLARAAGPPRRIVAVGGGTRGDLWAQIVSDVSGVEQDVPAETLGAAYGDALLAAIGTGLVPPETDWVRRGRSVSPDPDVRDVYDELFDLYERLYPATADVVHRLAAVQGQPERKDPT